MIQLHRDYLLVETPQGQIIPCSADMVAVELVGDGKNSLDPALVEQAAAAVLHYFKEDLGRSTVTVGEFSRVLEEALRALGIHPPKATPGKKQVTLDLKKLAATAGESFELGFYPQLRQLLQHELGRKPEILRFHDLRSCVKQLLGAKRWTPRCQGLNDEIVKFLRDCLETEAAARSCQLQIR